MQETRPTAPVSGSTAFFSLVQTFPLRMPKFSGSPIPRLTKKLKCWFLRQLTFQVNRFYRHKRKVRTARVWSSRDRGEVRDGFMQTGTPKMHCYKHGGSRVKLSLWPFCG